MRVKLLSQGNNGNLKCAQDGCMVISNMCFVNFISYLRNNIWFTVAYRVITNGLEFWCVRITTQVVGLSGKVNNKHQNDKLLLMSWYMPVFYISFVNNELKMVVTFNAYRYPVYFRCYIKWVHQACFQMNKKNHENLLGIYLSATQPTQHDKTYLFGVLNSSTKARTVCQSSPSMSKILLIQHVMEHHDKLTSPK